MQRALVWWVACDRRPLAGFGGGAAPLGNAATQAAPRRGRRAAITVASPPPPAARAELLVDVRRRLAGFELSARFRTRGRMLALLGASGSGKSMTLAAIAGLATPEEGRIELNGRVLFDAKSGVRLPPAGAAGGRGLSGRRPVPAPDRARKHRLRAARCRLRSGSAASRNGHAWPASMLCSTATPINSPAGSASAWPWRAPWPCSPKPCSSTSRSAPSIPTCAGGWKRRCAPCSRPTAAP